MVFNEQYHIDEYFMDSDGYEVGPHGLYFDFDDEGYTAEMVAYFIEELRKNNSSIFLVPDNLNIIPIGTKILVSYIIG